MATSSNVSSEHLLRFRWDNRMGPVLMLNYSNKTMCFALICHRKPERCFTIFGHESPLCSRCTGLGLGLFAFLVLSLFHFSIPSIFGLMLMMPLILDGFSQLMRLRQSNNPLRLITGILFSVGCLSFLVS
jgi:uncharacterized membrane protein